MFASAIPSCSEFMFISILMFGGTCYFLKKAAQKNPEATSMLMQEGASKMVSVIMKLFKR